MSRITGSLLTGNNVSVVLDGKPHIISSSAGIFEQVVEAVSNRDADALEALLNPKANISTATQGRISYNGVDLMFNGEVIHNAITDRLHYLWSRGLNYAPLLKFLDNLMDNPSYRAVKETYGFLEACNLPITDDGHFLAYKMVNQNYTDCYTGTMDNSVGKVVEVARNMVDEDSTRTCSHGLHCCSREYLFSGYGASSGRIVTVKVNPRDVVAVPNDYNNSKMRVCRYEVVGELTRDDLNLDEYYTPDYSPDLDDDLDDDSFDDLDDPFDDLFEDEDEDEDEVVTTTTPTRLSPREREVQDIKRLLAQDEMSIVNIARLYNNDEGTVRKIRDGKIWKHVTI